MTESTSTALSVMISLAVILISAMVMNPLLVILIAVLISVAFSRTSSSARLQNSATNIPSTSSSRSSPSVKATSSSRSTKYDVFLSFRGEDTRKTFVDHLYSALVDRLIHTYKDDETLLRGDTIGSSLMNAIDESHIAIIVFSKNYATSSWCLDELAYIMKCNKEGGKIVMPIFYHVDPSDVRKQKGKYGEAFVEHRENNNNKIELWREALVAAGNIAGWEINHNVNGYEAKCIKGVVGRVLDILLYSSSVVDENLVGMGTRLHDLKLQLQIGLRGVRMIGIWGIRGGGKTTLASSLYIEISNKFDSCCFVGNIKDESNKLQHLQEKILSTVFKTKVKVSSVDIGKDMIKSRLRLRNVLIVLDDVDDRKQLEALAGSHDWFGDGSRIIITTTDEHLLRTHRVDEVSHVNLLSDEEAIQLFDRRAYNENKIIEDYSMLSQRVVSYAAGLPLALIVLGSFLYDKNKEEWISTLDRLRDIPEMEVVEKLKISYDGLKSEEKELFLDIACFFKGKEKDEAMVMLDACGFHPRIGVKVLLQKALITIKYSDYCRPVVHNLPDLWSMNTKDVFEMHDLVQEMGQYIVRGEHPNNPEKHTRLWRQEEIEDMCFRNETMENYKTEAIITSGYPSGFGKFLSKANKLRLLSVKKPDIGDISDVPEYLSNELRYLSWHMYPASPFPESFQARKLVVLTLFRTTQEELWRGYKCLPCLKELHLSYAYNLVMTPDIGGFPGLQKLTLDNCEKLEEIHPSLGNHSSLVSVHVKMCEKLEEFPTIVQMRKLEVLDISYCYALSKFPKMEANMDSLVNLSLTMVGIDVLPLTVGKYCTKLQLLKLEDCFNLKSIEGNFHALKHLQKCNITCYPEPIKLPKDLFLEHIHLEELCLLSTRQPCIPHLPRLLRILTLHNCGLKDGEIPCDIGELSNLQELDLSMNQFSRLNFSLSRLTRLKLLNLQWCRKLVELPELPTSIAILCADFCESLEVVGDTINQNCKWLCEVSFRQVKSVIRAVYLLRTMLQGHAIEYGCMRLSLKGLEIPKAFTPPLLLAGNRYRLKLPENWHNHFSGFLLIATLRDYTNSQYITMKHGKDGSTSRYVFWEESVEDAHTWVGYVSFASLKHTRWFDPTSIHVDFGFEIMINGKPEACSSGFGVRLVSKTGQSDQIETDFSQVCDYYTSEFSIQGDLESHLACGFGINVVVIRERD